MIQKHTENIYSFHITLPRNPLKWLNCYVVRGINGGRDLLIDSGFNTPKCLADLKKGMKEMELDPKNVDVFFTHAHADHVGNANALKAMGCRLMMGRVDYEYFLTKPWINQVEHSKKDGIPEFLRISMDAGQGQSDDFTADLVEEGAVLRYGGYELECILTPGHTPGHMCLYDRAHKLMFTGDHVLFDITPNITYGGEGSNMLGDYLKSLDKIEQYDVELALPSHRTTGGKSFLQRVEEIKQHHEVRLAEAERVVREFPDICGYEAAQHMDWSIHASSWEEFPNGQKWFATGEALAHLVYLDSVGRIKSHESEAGLIEFSPV